MSRAEDLLLALSADTPVHVHPVVDSDTHYIIDPITRQLSNPNSGKTVIMQFDHYSEQFTFEIPRYVDGHDMLQCNTVRVHFLNIYSEFEQNAGLSYVDDLSINPEDPSTVTCTWLIPRDATQLVGPLNFLVQYACVDENGKMTYEWHTDINTDNTVRAGMNNGEEIAVVYADVLEQWRATLFGAKDSILAEIVAAEQTSLAVVEESIVAKGKETLDSIPEDYINTYNLAKEGARTKANAILLETEGKTIAVDDSEDAYVRNLRIFGKTTQDTLSGKNLFDYKRLLAGSNVGTGVTIRCVQYSETAKNGDYVVLNGTAQTSESLRLGTIELNETTSIALSANNTVYAHSSPNNCLFIETADDNYTRKAAAAFGSTANASVSVTLEAGTYRYGIAVSAQSTFSNFEIRPQLEIGSTATDFEPYTGGMPAPNPFFPVPLDSIKPTISIYGKNLLNLNRGGSVVNVTETVTNGLVSFSGTASGSGGRTAFGRSDHITLQPGTYYLSMTPHSGRAATPCLTKSDTTVAIATEEGAFTVAEPVTVYLGFNYITGDVYDAQNVGVQLERGAVATEYEPYKPVQILAIDHSIPGIPVAANGNYTDSNGQQWICDEIDFKRGVYIKRINVIPIESEHGMTYNSTDHVLYYSLNPSGVYGQKIYCTHFADLKFNGNGSSMKFTGFASADEFKSFVDSNEVVVAYAMSTHIETALTTAELAAFEAMRTHHTNTTVVNDKGAYMVMEYNGDIKRYLDKLPKASGAEVQAAVDAWLTAHFASAEGVSF